MNALPAHRQTSKLNLLVLGAGAIGGYVGGSLALAGHRVVFLCRPRTAKQLRKQGLELAFPDTTHTLAPLIADIETVPEVGSFDLLILAVKVYDTQAALAPLLPFKEQMPPILCLQNGVNSEAKLSKLFGPEKVIPGTVLTAVRRRSRGEIVVERLRGVGVGGEHPLVSRLIEEMNAAGLNAVHYNDPRSMKWSKLLTNLLANPTSAILDMTPAEVFAHPGLFRLEMAQLREALSVMNALGIRVVDLPETRVRLLAFAARRLPLRLSQKILGRKIGQGRGGKMPSYHIDLHLRTGRSEVEFIHGAVVKYGKKTGIPTPVNAFLTQTMLALVHEELPLPTFWRRPDKLLSQLEASPFKSR